MSRWKWVRHGHHRNARRETTMTTPSQIRDMIQPGRDSREVLDYFGCPECGQPSDYTNARSTHIGYCLPCQVSWIIGANLFSSWQYETEDEQRAQYEQLGIPRMRRLDWPS
jgi:hypothetical protein